MLCICCICMFIYVMVMVVLLHREAHKQQNSKLLQQHFAKNCKQATEYISHELPLLEASGPPSIAGETADQHCFEVNFA